MTVFGKMMALLYIDCVNVYFKKNASKQCLHETVPLNIMNTVHNNQNKYEYYKSFLRKRRFGIFYVRYTIQDPALNVPIEK